MNVPYAQGGETFEMKAEIVDKGGYKAPVFEAKVKKDIILYDQPRDLMARENAQISVEEVNAIDNLFNTNTFTDTLATKANFISNVKDHKIIHLSTHAKSNDIQGDNSFIAFSKSQDSLESNQLYVRELYNLDLDADI